MTDSTAQKPHPMKTEATTKPVLLEYFVNSLEGVATQRHQEDTASQPSRLQSYTFCTIVVKPFITPGPVTALSRYLSDPKTRKILARKPGEEGFSLIELVVVVAVLAILAAIAVPAYTNMNQQAADAANLTNLKNAYKECAYNIARGVATPDFDQPQDNSYYTYNKPGNCGTSTSTKKLKGTSVSDTNDYLEIDLVTGAKSQGGNLSW